MYIEKYSHGTPQPAAIRKRHAVQLADRWEVNSKTLRLHDSFALSKAALESSVSVQRRSIFSLCQFGSMTIPISTHLACMAPNKNPAR